jgi:hypothetical protein
VVVVCGCGIVVVVAVCGIVVVVWCDVGRGGGVSELGFELG